MLPFVAPLVAGLSLPIGKPLGAPPQLATLGVDESILLNRGSRSVWCTRLSARPAAFLIRNFLSHDECASIVAAADASGALHPAETSGRSDARKRCDICCLGLAHPAVSCMTQEAASLLLAPEVIAQQGTGCEDLHVLKYHPGGEFRLHYDTTSEALPRVCTVLFYLNGEGATWFPFADDASVEPEWFAQRNLVLDRAAALDPYADGGGNGLRVDPTGAGDALVFYNFDAGDGEVSVDAPAAPGLDPYSLHAGLPVGDGTTKWLASHFFQAPALFAPPLDARRARREMTQTAP